jgi:hypothetical protein
MVAPEPGVVLELQDGAPKTRSNWVVPRRGSSRSFRMAPKADVAAVTAMEADAGCPHHGACGEAGCATAAMEANEDGLLVARMRQVGC